MIAAERAAMGLDELRPAWVLFDASETTVVHLIVEEGELMPAPEAFAAVLATWRQRFGARLADWNGCSLRLAVDRPPADLEEARRVAFEHYLMCPGNESGRVLVVDPPEHRLHQIMSREWVCNWSEA